MKPLARSDLDESFSLNGTVKPALSGRHLRQRDRYERCLWKELWNAVARMPVTRKNRNNEAV